MAKAKSSDTAGASRKKAPASKMVAGEAPLIDTNLAAQAAAKMLMARKQGLVSATPTAPVAGSSSFRQLKESLAKPHVGGMDAILNTTAPAETPRSGTTFSQQNQRGHNQTFGADVARTGVPRRTAG